jgi:hypothetical protein
MMKLPQKPQQVVNTTKKLLNDEEFKSHHRTSPKVFLRERKLTFSLVILLILQKTMKSIQLLLNEVFGQIDLDPATTSAFTQARRHLKHTAFIELNQKAIVAESYQDGTYQRYQGFRLLAIDGSKIRLPESRDIQEAFGTIKTTNGKDNQISGKHAHGLASVCYDVLNRIVIDSQLGEARASEVDLAVTPLPATQTHDLLLCDRGYISYRWLATGIQHQRYFVVRGSAGSFKPARQMLKGLGADSQVVDLTPSFDQRLDVARLGLPSILRVRFVRVVLPNGDFEVLVTNLLDEQLFPTSSFGQLYPRRWGVETLYGVVKTRLQLENFSGLTAEAVRQDFYATIFISNLETVFTEEANSRLEKKTSKNLHPQQVNQAVSFNAIKNYVIALFYLENSSEEILRQLTQLFLTNPSSVRRQRSVPRRQRSPTQRLNYHRRLKKICF